jgi:hypothetical protein
MASYDNVRTISAVADVATTAQVHRFARFGANGRAGDAADVVAGDIVDGIIGEGVAAGDVFPLIVPDGSIAMVEAGAAIAQGANVATNATGQAVTAVATDFIMGVALDAAGALGDIIRIQFIHKGLAV